MAFKSRQSTGVVILKQQIGFEANERYDVVDDLDDDESDEEAFSGTRQRSIYQHHISYRRIKRRERKNSPGHVDVYVRLSDDTAGAAVSGPVLLVDWDFELVGERIHVVFG